MGIKNNNKNNKKVMDYYSKERLGIKGFRYKNLKDPKYLRDKSNLIKQHSNGWWITWGLDGKSSMTRIVKK
tara:strand:- start:161 stop:373 length:213 start_codon:yes stop_codon:yes gene_type:complete